jgi:hypothetical protein
MTTLDLETHQARTPALDRLIAQLGIAQNHMKDLLAAEAEVSDRIREAQLQVQRILERFAALVDIVTRTYQLRSTKTTSAPESDSAEPPSPENLVPRLDRLVWGARNLITIMLRALAIPPDVHVLHLLLQGDFDQLFRLVEEIRLTYEPLPRPNDTEVSPDHECGQIKCDSEAS